MIKYYSEVLRTLLLGRGARPRELVFLGAPIVEVQCRHIRVFIFFSLSQRSKGRVHYNICSNIHFTTMASPIVSPRDLFWVLLLATAFERTWTFTLRPNFVAVRSSVLSPRMVLPPGQVIVFFDASDDEDDEEEDGEEDDDDDDEEQLDPYQQAASSEFLDSSSSRRGELATTTTDWGGALGKLRQRVDDVESGKSQDPPHVLFRLMSSQSPSQAIGSFVNSANPEVVQAMSGAVGSLLGGLSNPASGVETIVKATGDKVASLCFQLQMTGYLFRNAEYVLALKDLMNLQGSASLDEVKEAFDRLDTNGSGYIEASEVSELLDELYDGKTPAFEVQAFVKFFDQNDDGKVSWDEFQRGLMGMVENARVRGKGRLSLPGAEEEDDDDESSATLEQHISGTLEIELEDGKKVEVDAATYIKTLKAEADALKRALQAEKGVKPRNGDSIIPGTASPPSTNDFESIAGYISSRQGDVESLTEGISPEIVQTMKMLVDFVLEGGESSKGKNISKEEVQMEIPGSALQQLALWQLILGYRLREAEAKGDYLKLLE